MNLRGNDMDTKNQDKYRGMMLDGRYELVELIGSGGMAVVYKAMCHRLNRYVAVKIMRPELAKNEKFRRRFQTESQAIAKLSHPNIVGVYDVSRTDHVEYIVMELVDGITLKQYLQDHGPLDAVQAVDFSLQIARALAHAHGKGIVHRDIKPQNILVVNDGVIKVADFGIANLQSEVPDVENEAIGSVHYISPEQARGLPVDGRSDIYSLGIVMYEMLSGKLPFDGDDDRTVALKHLSAVPTPLREIAPSVPEALEKIVMKAMEASLDNRYQTADALAADLEALQKSLTGSLDRIEGNVAPLSTAGELGREDYVRRRRRAHRVSMLSGFFGVMAAILIIAVFLWNYFLSDIFVVNQRVAIPNFVGSNYETIINSKEFKGKYNFDLIYEIDPNVERGIIIGHPRCVIRDGTVDQRELRSLRWSIDDLMEMLRSSGTFDISEVLFAIVETNGSLSIYPKFSKRPATNGDLSMLDIEPPASEAPPVIVVADGELDRNALGYCNLSERWLKELLTERKLKLEDIFLLSCNRAAEVHIVKREKKA